MMEFGNTLVLQKKRFYNALKGRDIYKIIYGVDIDGILHNKQKTMTRMKFPEFLIDLMINLTNVSAKDLPKKPPRPSKMSPATMPSHLNNLFRTTRERGSEGN